MYEDHLPYFLYFYMCSSEVLWWFSFLGFRILIYTVAIIFFRSSVIQTVVRQSTEENAFHWGHTIALPLSGAGQITQLLSGHEKQTTTERHHAPHFTMTETTELKADNCQLPLWIYVKSLNMWWDVKTQCTLFICADSAWSQFNQCGILNENSLKSECRHES